MSRVDVAVPTLPGEPLNGYTMTRITHDKQVNHFRPVLTGFTATQKTYNQQIIDDSNILCPVMMGLRRRVTSGTTHGIWCWLTDLNRYPFAY